MGNILAIALGGAIGAVLRFFLRGWMDRLVDSPFPLGTLTVNVLGCLLMGLLGAYFTGPHLVREEHRAALLVGVLGAFTTFSTFGWETFLVARQGQVGHAVANVLLSNVLGIGAVVLGFGLGQKIQGG